MKTTPSTTTNTQQSETTDQLLEKQLLAMLTLQQQMNERINQNWQAMNRAWYRAIWTECAELLDHMNWKWWRAQAIDWQQVILELVDIWHFGLSDLLQRNPEPKAWLPQLIQLFNKSDFNTAAPLTIDATKENNIAFNHDDIPLEQVRQLTEALAEQCLTTKHFNCATFTQLLVVAKVAPDQLYRQYIGKNVLNQFRQNKGYKQGQYQKLWQGQEDNNYLIEIVSQLDSTLDNFQDQVMSQLEFYYKRLVLQDSVISEK